MRLCIEHYLMEALPLMMYNLRMFKKIISKYKCTKMRNIIPNMDNN